MVKILDNPDSEDVKIYGSLGRVSEKERKRILGLPFGQFKPEIKRLEKAIKEHEKKQKEKEALAKAKPVYKPSRMFGELKQ